MVQVPIASLDIEKNLEMVVRACEDAAGQGAELVVFPELCDLGQVPGRDRDFGARYLAAVQCVPGPFTEHIGQCAHRLGLHVVVGVAESHPRIAGTAYDAGVLIGPSGDVIGVQRKLHPAGDERHYFAPGDQISVFDTCLGKLAIGICYDLYFPEVPRTAALRGADLLCGLFNVTRRPEWPDRLGQLAGVRAYENMQHVLLVNRVGENHGRVFGGESAAACPPGVVVARAPADEQAIVCVDLDRSDVVRERAYRPVFADRRPELYDLG